MGQQIKRHIGRILLDGGFLSNNDIDHALEEQKLTRELLGQVLVRMGVLKARDINAPLLIQDHLSSIDDAVKIAAGERQLLGALLVRSGRITGEQLDRAIAQKKKTGEKLGEVFTRLGMLTERQLAALIEFQHNQGETTSGPLKLGELLVSTGYITRDQLDVALYKQSLSHKKIGEILVEEGYISPSRIKYGFRLQKMLVNSVLAAILFLGTSVPSIAASVSLQWDPNTETDLAGYRVYYKADSSELPFDGVEAVEGAAPIDVQSSTTTIISGLDPGRTYYLTVTAYNKAGLESPYSKIVAKVAPLSDSTAPDIVSFTIPSVATSLTIPITTFTATDNIGVTGYLVTDSSSVPSIDDAAWSASAPLSFTFSTSGSNMLYAWAKDAAGNLSNGVGRSVTITLPDSTSPVVSAFTLPATANAKTVAITSFIAADNIKVTGYLVTTSATKPAVGAAGWKTTAPTSVTFSGTGSKTAYAWAKDAAGNVSASSSATVMITLPDTTAPVVNSFSLPAASTSLTVPVTTYTATDSVGVNGYLITESATKPAAGATGWTTSAPTSFTFTGAGSKTAYAWAKDAAGNVSLSRSATVFIDTIAPTVSIGLRKDSAAANGMLSVTANANDDVGVSRVEFYVNGVLTSTATVEPYVFSWDSTAGASGSYTLMAKVFDAAGNSGQSGTVRIYVPNVKFR